MSNGHAVGYRIRRREQIVDPESPGLSSVARQVQQARLSPDGPVHSPGDDEDVARLQSDDPSTDRDVSTAPKTHQENVTGRIDVGSDPMVRRPGDQVHIQFIGPAAPAYALLRVRCVAFQELGVERRRERARGFGGRCWAHGGAESTCD